MIKQGYSLVKDWRSLCIVMVLALLGVAPVGAQKGSVQDADELNQQVLQLYSQGRYREAIRPAEQALAIREQALGPMHPDTATSLNNLAELYRITGSDEKAEPLLHRALAIREQALGPMHPDTAGSLNNLAGLYHTTGVYEKAEPLYQRALAIREQALGPMHPDTATSLNNLGLLFDATGAYEKAEPLLQRALAIQEQALGSAHPATAGSLNNLAEHYRAIGAYAKAEPLYQRALAIHEQALGPTHPATATSLNNLALLYDATGAYAKAEPLYQRALAIQEKMLGPTHPNMAGLLNNLAELYRVTGAYTKAEPLYQRALAIREQTLGSRHPDTATALDNLAALYSTTGAYEKAEPLMQQALAIREQVLGSTHPATATSLDNLGALYSNIGAYAKAEPLYQRALAIREQALGPTHTNTAGSLNNLALLYRATGAYAKAEPLYQRALAIREQELGLRHPDTATALNNLALLYSATGAYEKAEPLMQQALAIREQALGHTHPDTAQSLNNLGWLHWAAGKPATALPLFERAQVMQERHTAEFLLSGSEVRKQAYVQQLRGITFAKISLSLALSDVQAAALGLTSVLHAKGRVLDSMSDSLARLRQRLRPEDRTLVEQFIGVVQQSSKLHYQGPGDLPPDDYRARLRELAAKQEQLETELATRSAEFQQQLTPITLATVQAALPPEVTLLEWFRYQPFDPKAKDKQKEWAKPRYVAYVLQRAGAPVAVDLGEAESIELLVQDFRKALSGPQHTYVKEVAKDLSERLINPLQRHLGNTEQLLISPDGALNLVPFGALLDDTGEYLTTKREITYLTSGRDLLRFGTATIANSEAVVVANPDFGPSIPIMAQTASSVRSERSADFDRGGMVFTPLSGTAAEAKALRPLLKVKDEHLLTQAKASEARLKQLHGPRVLHIATHGFFLNDREMAAATLKTVGFSQDQRPLPLGENPLLRSGLALAGANQRRSGTNDDGILTAAEVAQMDLRGTQLVVLSACETGVGELQNGEGVYGLRRALVLAGAQTQVASLWKVADEATKDLMVDYYQRLLDGEGRSAALRQAQQPMIDSQDRSHPYYWAAFVPIGDWKPLTATR